MSQPYVGEIRLFAGTFAPLNWALCDGSILAIAENPTLFNLIGTTYGGDGQQTFALPDLRGRVPMHMGTNGSTFQIGQSAGVESVTLTNNQIPAHSHLPQASAVAADSTNPAGAIWGVATQARPYSASAPSVAMDPNAGGVTGGNQPHDNMMPFLAINFIISLFGIYPSP
jgi:microcystin-dependent protein